MEAEAAPRGLELSPLDPAHDPAAAPSSPPHPPHPPSPPRQPSPAPGAEKNGLVMKIPPEEEEGGEEEGAAALGGAGGASGGPKFTGLGKEELLREAGTPPWARARLVLLVLFWGGWLGMLGAAAAIVARAPRCQPLPAKAWWELKALYRAPPKAFGGDLKGVERRLGYLKEELQVGGLVLGPLYPPKSPGDTLPPLGQLDPALGTPQDFSALLDTAKDKGLKVLLDLTPNPRGGPVWGDAAEDPGAQRRVKEALGHWLGTDIAGIFLDGIEELPPSVVAEWRNLTEEKPSPSGVTRVLVGGTRLQQPWRVPQHPGAPRLLVGPFLQPLGEGPQGEGPQGALAELLAFLSSPNSSSSSPAPVGLGWSVGSPWESWVSPNLRLQQQLLLVWGLPGTPVLSYGDELGLQRPPRNEELPPMPWETIEGPKRGGNASEPPAELELCRALSSLRGRELSLLLGEARAVAAGGAVAVLRRWDQSERYLLLLNPLPGQLRPFSGGWGAPGGPGGSGGGGQDPPLPAEVTLRFSTGPASPGQHVRLEEVEVGAYGGVVLGFPYNPQ